MPSSVAFSMQIKPPSLDKEADPMAGLMGLMKVRYICINTILCFFFSLFVICIMDHFITIKLFYDTCFYL